MSDNSNLQRAKKVKDDEFFTRLQDVEKEVENYKDYFRGKSVLCNCNDAPSSAFWIYFHFNFRELGLKKLVATKFNRGSHGYVVEYLGGDDNDTGHISKKFMLNGDGGFESEECLSLLDESDVVVTNPPFSLFRKLVGILIEKNKDFLLVGNLNAFTCKDMFPLIAKKMMWLGNNSVKEFNTTIGVEKFGNIYWYTNIDSGKRPQPITLKKEYIPSEYRKYDTYEAIEVPRVVDIPFGYKGIMGVPISFINHYNPNQFEIVGEFKHGKDNEFDLAEPIIDGKRLFARIAIREKEDNVQ